MILAMAAVFATIQAARPAPPPSVAVVQVTARVTAGAVLTAEQVSMRPVAARLLPEEALTSLDAAVGRTAVAGLTRGQILTAPLLLSPHQVSGPGRVLMPLRLQDSTVVALLRVGDMIDVLATDSGSGRTAVVASRARVVTLPPPVAERSSHDSDSLLLVEVDRPAANRLAQAAVQAQLSLIMR